MEDAAARMFMPTGDVVCRAHVADEYLLAVTPEAEGDSCVLCSARHRPFVDLDELQDRVVAVVRTYRRRAIDELFHDRETESGYAFPDQWMEDTWDVVHELFGSAFDGVLIEHVAFSIDPDYWFRPGLLWLEGAELYMESWSDFRRLVAADGLELEGLLRGAADLPSRQDEDTLQPSTVLPQLLALVDEVGIVKTLRPDTRWVRALYVPPGEDLTAGRLGTAPARLSTENRMNRAGSPMFYGAEDLATATAEIGPPPAGMSLITGIWVATRPLVVLDLVDLGEAPDFYEWERAWLRWRLQFLADFAADVSKPVTDHTRTEYRPTQLLMEFVRSRHPHIDGIVYRSSRTGRRCCAIDIPNAACVAPGSPASGSPVQLTLVEMAR